MVESVSIMSDEYASETLERGCGRAFSRGNRKCSKHGVVSISSSSTREVSKRQKEGDLVKAEEIGKDTCEAVLAWRMYADEDSADNELILVQETLKNPAQQPFWQSELISKSYAYHPANLRNRCSMLPAHAQRAKCCRRVS